MSETSGKPKSERASFEEKKLHYFRRIGIQVRKELKVLAREPFNSFSPKSDADRWYAANSGIVETALALKLANLLKFSEDERLLLVQSAMTDHATRRMQYTEKDANEVSTAEYDAFLEDGAHPLIAAGVDSRVVVINRAPSPNFKVAVAKGEIQPKTPEEETLFRLQRIAAYIENSVEPFFPNGYKQKPNVEIGDPRTKVERAKERYKDIALETAIVPRSIISKNKNDSEEVRVSKLDIESAVTEAFGEEILKEIREKNPHLRIPEGTALWQLLQSEIYADIENGARPKVKD